jgi:flavin-dependent dehydrogenase
VRGFARSTDLFVIGGGPAGLAAAIAARLRGFDVTIADGAIPPVDKACGEGVMPDGLAAAHALGLQLEAAGGHPFSGIRFCDGGSSVQAAFPHGHGLGLRRTELHRLMVDRAAEVGVRMVWGAAIGGISREGVLAGGRMIPARWIVGADGGHSAVRRFAGLDACAHQSHRFGFRRHYKVAPWSDFMEIHWADGCQFYITPVSAAETCVALISRDPRLRIEDALAGVPEVQRRLRGAAPATPERGAVTASRRLRSVYRGNVALVGDASGSVDAVTGEGLCLLFQQAGALADALAAGDLARYQAAHRRIGRRPEWMSNLMLLLDRHRGLRHRAIRAMAQRPRIFERLLAMHVGELTPADMLTNGMALGWRMLAV